MPERSTMISRHWRGLCRCDRADDYIEHLRTETFPALKDIPGFVSASILRRVLPAGIEFLIITQWRSLAAIRAFAGAAAEIAVVPAKVQEMMLEYDREARHYEVCF